MSLMGGLASLVQVGTCSFCHNFFVTDLTKFTLENLQAIT